MPIQNVNIVEQDCIRACVSVARQHFHDKRYKAHEALLQALETTDEATIAAAVIAATDAAEIDAAAADVFGPGNALIYFGAGRPPKAVCACCSAERLRGRLLKGEKCRG